MDIGTTYSLVPDGRPTVECPYQASLPFLKLSFSLLKKSTVCLIRVVALAIPYSFPFRSAVDVILSVIVRGHCLIVFPG